MTRPLARFSVTRQRTTARGGRALYIGAAILCFSLSGCGGSSSQESAPSLGKFLHKGYTVISQRSVGLVTGEPDADVVVSVGPGLHPGAPTAGGTGDVQVLTYDPQATRWVLSFDAADRADTDVVIPGDPLLDQSHTIAHPGAAPVWFTGADKPSLVVWGMDEFTNHPDYNVAVVSFARGTATVNWADTGRDPTSEDLARPVVVGQAPHQTIRLTASYLTSQDSACCAVRDFTRTISMRNGAIQVTADDRPYVGIYVTPDPESGGARVLRVDPGSPASGKLLPGDVITGLGAWHAGMDSQNLPDPIVDALAQHRAGQSVVFRIERGQSVSTVPIELSSVLNPGASAQPPTSGHLGVTVTNDMKIVDGSEASPLLNFGVMADDILVSINGQQLRNPHDLAVAMWGTGGHQIRLSYKDTTGLVHTISVTPMAGAAGGATTLVVDHM